MAGNTFGQLLRLTTFGESHGPAIGGILDGLPPHMPLDMERVQRALDKRKPGSSAMVTPRTEDDKIIILSGVFEGKTLGTPLSFYIENQNQHSKDYDTFKDVYRPGHGDYTYQMKYGHRDHRGGGRASARETAARVAGGAIAHQVLEWVLQKPVSIQSCVVQLGALGLKGQGAYWHATPEELQFSQTNPFHCPCPLTLPEWTAYLNDIKEKGCSVGANIFVMATGLPVGLGEPVFDKLDADLAKAFMSINAVKAVALGDTFSVAALTAGYDEMHYDTADGDNNDDRIKTSPTFTSNHAGGTLAGISSGQPITALIGFKPTSSSLTPRQGINKQNENVVISVTGRHDPCVALRAPPIVEAMMALTLADHLLRFRGQCGDNLRL